MRWHTCNLSWSGGEGLRRFKVFWMVTFLTVLLRARGAAGPGDTSLLEADLGEIGWLCIITFFRGVEFLQKRTTGAAGKNSKGEPSSCVGSGPSCCCRKTEQDSEDHCKATSREFASGSTCSSGISYSASSCCSNGPSALRKA